MNENNDYNHIEKMLCDENKENYNFDFFYKSAKINLGKNRTSSRSNLSLIDNLNNQGELLNDQELFVQIANTVQNQNNDSQIVVGQTKTNNGIASQTSKNDKESIFVVQDTQDRGYEDSLIQTNQGQNDQIVQIDEPNDESKPIDSEIKKQTHKEDEIQHQDSENQPIKSQYQTRVDHLKKAREARQLKLLQKKQHGKELGILQSKNKFKSKIKLSQSSRAGLIFPIQLFKKLIKKSYSNMRLGNGAAVYITAVIEYLTAELIDLAGDISFGTKKVRITPRHLMIAIKQDAEFNELLKDVTVSSGGVLPIINPIITLKPDERKKLGMKNRQKLIDSFIKCTQSGGVLEMNNKGQHQQQKEQPEKQQPQQSGNNGSSNRIEQNEQAGNELGMAGEDQGGDDDDDDDGRDDNKKPPKDDDKKSEKQSEESEEENETETESQSNALKSSQASTSSKQDETDPKKKGRGRPRKGQEISTKGKSRSRSRSKYGPSAEEQALKQKRLQEGRSKGGKKSAEVRRAKSKERASASPKETTRARSRSRNGPSKEDQELKQQRLKEGRHRGAMKSAEVRRAKSKERKEKEKQQAEEEISGKEKGAEDLSQKRTRSRSTSRTRRSKRPTSTERERDEEDEEWKPVEKQEEQVETPRKRGRPRKSLTPATEEEESPKKRRKSTTASIAPSSTPSSRKRPLKVAREKEEPTPKKSTTKKATESPLKEKEVAKSTRKQTKKPSEEEESITIDKKELALRLKSNKSFTDLIENVISDYLTEQISQKGERTIPIHRADSTKSSGQESINSPTSGTESQTSTPKKSAKSIGKETEEEKSKRFAEIGRKIIQDAELKASLQQDVLETLFPADKNIKKYSSKKRESPMP